LRQAGFEESGLDETRALLARASAVWSRWSCPASGRCCQLRTTGREPWLWPTEWQVLREALAAEARTLPAAREDGGCAFLDPEGRRCSVYEARPSGCRTFFCGDGRGPALPGQRTHDVLDQLASVNIGVEPSAQPQAMTTWLALEKKPAHR
jgi:hypothetical protein